MLRAGAGDLAAFEALVRKHQRPLLNFFRRSGVNADMEDLAQDTFVKLFRARRRYRPAAKFTTYLYAIARNVRIDAARRGIRADALRRRAAEHAETETPAGGGPGRRLDAEALLGRLTEPLRETVVLAILQGLAYEDVARILGVPAGTVKSWVFHAMERMRAASRET